MNFKCRHCGVALHYEEVAHHHNYCNDCWNPQHLDNKQVKDDDDERREVSTP